MGFLDTLAHAAMDNKKLHFNEEQFLPLTEDEKWIVTLSSPLSSFNGNFLNSIETGEDKERNRQGVKEMWNVIDRNTFEKNVEYIIAGGQRNKFKILWDKILLIQDMRDQTPMWLKILNNTFAPVILTNKAYRLINFQSMKQQTGYSQQEIFTKIPNISQNTTWVSWLDSDFKKKFSSSIHAVNSLVAWDAVRLVSLTRWAIELGYIDRNEFSHFAGALKDEVKQSYTSWKEVSMAYLVGGLIWKYTEGRMENLVRTNVMLLKDSKSPYQTIPF